MPAVARRLRGAAIPIVAASLWLTASPALAAEPGAGAPAEERIAEGVFAAGVDVSGLTVAEAAALLQRKLGVLALRPVGVSVAGRRFKLGATRAKLSFDPLLTAKRALQAGKKAKESGGTPTAGGGARQQLASVPAAVSFSRARIRDWAAVVKRRVDRSARSARLRIGIAKMNRRRSQVGLRLDARRLRRTIEAAYADPLADRHIKQAVAKVAPALSDAELVRRYPVVLTIDRHNFKLRLFKNLRLRRTYGIALGAAGYSTPAGIFRIRQRQVNPAWSAPNKPWAGAYAGRTVPGGAPDNPLKARWLGVANGVGIHGTSAEWSIGTRASHGCIRMRVAEVKALYRQVPLGTPIRISR